MKDISGGLKAYQAFYFFLSPRWEHGTYTTPYACCGINFYRDECVPRDDNTEQLCNVKYPIRSFLHSCHTNSLIRKQGFIESECSINCISNNLKPHKELTNK